jgi:rubrerythrin
MTERRFDSIAGIIAFAIQREIDAAAGYARLAAEAKTPGLRELAEDLRAQEVEHRRILEGLPPDLMRELGTLPVPDLGLVDALPDEPLSGDMTLQDTLIFAAKKEAQAIALYESLARLAASPGQDRVFLFLAGQERQHKLRLEAEYETHVLQEN